MGQHLGEGPATQTAEKMAECKLLGGHAEIELGEMTREHIIAEQLIASIFKTFLGRTVHGSSSRQ